MTKLANLLYLLTSLACAGLTQAGGSAIISTNDALSTPQQRRASSSGCGKKPDVAAGHADTRKTKSGREYKVYVPDSYSKDKPVPVILSYHGLGGTIASHAKEARLHEEKYNRGQIVVYLQGLKNDEGQPTWWGAPGVTNDDVGFTHDVLDAIESGFCVDDKRLYATGMSQGGGFVGKLACDAGASARIAAFSPVAGAHYIDSVTDAGQCKPRSVDIPCRPGREGVAVMHFHGGADDTIHYGGGMRKGACLPAIEHWVGQWSARDGGSAKTSKAEEKPIAGTKNGKRYDYKGSKVSLVYAGDDVKHVWESKELGTADLEATSYIMDFFGEQSL